MEKGRFSDENIKWFAKFYGLIIFWASMYFMCIFLQGFGALGGLFGGRMRGNDGDAPDPARQTGKFEYMWCSLY